MPAKGLFLFLTLFLIFFLIPYLPNQIAPAHADTLPSAAQYKEDFNGDGTINLADVIALLLFQHANPGNLQADYNGDGSTNIVDAVALCIAISEGRLTPIKPAETEVVHGITLVSIPGGSFQMGSESGHTNERPVHSVSLSAFQISKYEITQAQYQAVIGTNPSYFSGDGNRPVENVSLYDAVIFCNRLSEAAGLQPCYDLSTWECDFTKNGFRLPTEAEWEYSCRAGTSTKFYTGESEADLDLAGWYSNNSENTTWAVGCKQANSFGLCDMIGNVLEWCHDWYGDYQSEQTVDPQGPDSGGYRIIRGGGWFTGLHDCSSTHRFRWHPAVKYNTVGFRIVRR